MADTNGLTNSDDLGFWALHLHEMTPMGYAPPPEPEPMPAPEPDLADMSLEDYAANRERLGLPDTGDLLGIRPWRRPANQQNNEYGEPS